MSEKPQPLPDVLDYNDVWENNTVDEQEGSVMEQGWLVQRLGRYTIVATHKGIAAEDHGTAAKAREAFKELLADPPDPGERLT